MTKQKTTKKCKGPECDRDATAVDLCGSHYAQKRSGKELTKLRPRRPNGSTASPQPKVVEPVKVEKKVAHPTPPTSRPKKRSGMRDWICPKCLKTTRCLGVEVGHRCPENKSKMTVWVLRDDYKPPVEV